MVVMQAARSRRNSTALWVAAALVVAINAFVWTRWPRRRGTRVSEPVADRLPVGLGLE